MNFKFELNALSFLIGLNLAIFLIVQILFNVFNASPSLVIDYVLFGGITISDGVNYGFHTLITSNFLHFQFLHLLFNLYALFRIGKLVINLYGSKVLFYTYILSGIGSSLLTIIFYTSLNGNIFSLGASGSIFGLLGLLIGGSLKKYRYGMSFPFTLYDFLPVIVLSILVDFYPGFGINHFAHFGGLFTGIVLGLLIKHTYGFVKSSIENLIDNILYWLAVVILIAAYLVNITYFIFS